MADARVFARLEGQMPKLLSEMRADLGEHPLVREFTLLKRCWTYCREREFQYYYEDHPELDGMAQILENRGLISDTGDEGPKRYVILEELAEYLTAGQVSSHETALPQPAATPVAAVPSAQEPDLERLIHEKRYLELPAAARYLGLSIAHVRRLARNGKVSEVGGGRPMKISTESLRAYKGT
jgi:hypothetical protein